MDRRWRAATVKANRNAAPRGEEHRRAADHVVDDQLAPIACPTPIAAVVPHAAPLKPRLPLLDEPTAGMNLIETTEM